MSSYEEDEKGSSSAVIENQVNSAPIQSEINNHVEDICDDAEFTSFVPSNGAVLSFDNIEYYIKKKKSEDARGKKILRGISGIMKPGLNAIMGPTGSGKSSLLDVLAGRKDPVGLYGNIFLNGRPVSKKFQRISGYVVQKDIITGTLTVRENLWFCANMRLPMSVSQESKAKIIEEALNDLGLNDCADTKVGTDFIRGVSGGEKKRACIAAELITSPSVLFLDEPTTGLDASTANAVMILLKRLANKGRTIIFSIHQPRYSIFRLFNRLTLLSLGRLIYHGSFQDALPYFETLGYKCKEHNNPADFFLDIINGDSTALANNCHLAIKSSSIQDNVVDNTSNQTFAQTLANNFESSQIYKDTEVELNEISKTQVHKTDVYEGTKTYATPFYYQLGQLLKRTFLNVIRNPLAFAITLIINTIIGVVFGVLYFQTDNSTTAGTQNRFGVLFFITTNFMFGSISAMEIFLNERHIFVHEYASGYYRVFAYFLAKLFADLLPIRTIGPIVFCSVTYWMVGLKSDAAAFLTFLLFGVLICYAAVAIALFFSVSVSTFTVANSFISLVFVFSILFSGLLLNIESVLPWLQWVQYLSLANYGLSGFTINEFRNQLFTDCYSNETLSTVSPVRNNCSTFFTDPITNNSCISVTGECFLHSQLGIGDGISPLTEWQLWQNAVAIFAMAFGLYSLTYIQLARTKTTT